MTGQASVHRMKIAITARSVIVRMDDRPMATSSAFHPPITSPEISQKAIRRPIISKPAQDSHRNWMSTGSREYAANPENVTTEPTHHPTRYRALRRSGRRARLAITLQCYEVTERVSRSGAYSRNRPAALPLRSLRRGGYTLEIVRRPKQTAEWGWADDDPMWPRPLRSAV